MRAEQIRIILADDHKLVRESFGLLLDSNKRFSVIRKCDNGLDAIEQARHLKPDLMLVDVNMSPVDGFEVVQKVLENNPSIKIIGLSINNQPSYARRMMSLGASGYITKTSSLEEIIHGIIEVYNGKQYISSEVRNMIL